MLDVLMNLDYVITNEFGEQVISPDPKVGIPTKGKYRFKIKWAQGDTLSESIKRGYFLVPNVREYWSDEVDDPFLSINGGQFQLIDPELSNYSDVAALAEKSYSFSTDWNDYPDPQVAIQCKDYFYELTYNRVFTVSQMMDSYNSGFLLNRKIAIKHILNPECASENNKFPVNDGQYRFDIIFILFSILLLVSYIIMNVIVLVFHIVGILLQILGQFLGFVLRFIVSILRAICDFINDVILENLRGVGLPPIVIGAFDIGCVFLCDGPGWYPLKGLQNVTWCDDLADQLTAWAEFIENLYKKFQNVQVPMLTYPDCELCDCSVGESTPGGDVNSVENDPDIGVQKLVAQQLNKNSFLAPITLGLIFNKSKKLIPNLPSKTSLIAPKAWTTINLAAPPNQGVISITNRFSLPNGTATERYYRNSFLIKASEISFVTSQNNVLITSIRLNYMVGCSAASSGILQLLLQNTNDTTYLKGNNWNSITNGMTTVFSNAFNVPTAPNTFNTCTLTGTGFNYTLGGLYVAMNYATVGDVLGPALAAVNSTGLINGMVYGVSPGNSPGPGTPPPVLYFTSSLRPSLTFTTTASIPTVGVTPISAFYREQSPKISSVLSGIENDSNLLVNAKTRVPESYEFGQNVDFNYCDTLGPAMERLRPLDISKIW